MPQRLRKLLTLLLVVTQVIAATSAARTVAAETGTPCCCCSDGTCCCSLQAREAGSCCCHQHAAAKPSQPADCCSQHQAKRRASSPLRCLGCKCGCQEPTRQPATPGPSPNDGREQSERLAAEAAETCESAPRIANFYGTHFILAAPAEAFFAGMDPQPLLCAWLL